MAGAFALTGGILPTLSQNPTAADQVEIDTDSAKQSSASALQLVDIKIKPTATPTPTIGITPGITITNPVTPPITPQITPPIQACLNNTAINLLVDLSSSMKDYEKIKALQTALNQFVGSLEPETVIGIEVFGSPFSFTNGAEQRLAFSRYGRTNTTHKRVTDAIAGLDPGGDGGTWMKAGFDLALSKITTAQAPDSSFKNYRFVSILFSDGVPEVSEHFGSQCVDDYSTPGAADYRCFAKAQDPRLPTGANNVATKLKGKIDKAYSVAIYNTQRASDNALITSLRTLLKDVSSGSGAPYYQDTTVTTPAQLTKLFDNVIKGICS